MFSEELGGRRRLEGRTAIRSVFDTLIEETRFSLKMFDLDGELFGLERGSVAQTLGRMLLAHHDNQVTLIVHETAFLERDAPHFGRLLGTFAPRLQVLRTDTSLRHVDRGLVLADRAALLRRPSFQQPLVFLDYDEAAVSAATSVFEQLLAQSGPGLSGRPTGL